MNLAGSSPPCKQTLKIVHSIAGLTSCKLSVVMTVLVNPVKPYDQYQMDTCPMHSLFTTGKYRVHKTAIFFWYYIIISM